MFSCFVPITFILSCAYSSFYILFFLRSELKQFIDSIFDDIVSIVSGENPDLVISNIMDSTFQVGATKINVFSRNDANWLVQTFLDNSGREIAHFDFLFQTLSDQFTKSVESELLDTASPYLVYLPDLPVEWKFLFDELTVSIFLVVSTITFLVILFAWVYIAQDERRPVFFFLLTIFAGFMMVLIAAHNYLILFIG